MTHSFVHETNGAFGQYKREGFRSGSNLTADTYNACTVLNESLALTDTFEIREVIGRGPPMVEGTSGSANAINFHGLIFLINTVTIR